MDPFCLRMKRSEDIFNTESELTQNRTEKQIMLFKMTVNWMFSDICYLVIGCFDRKIGVFQQTGVSVYYILQYITKYRKSRSNNSSETVFFRIIFNKKI